MIASTSSGPSTGRPLQLGGWRNGPGGLCQEPPHQRVVGLVSRAMSDHLAVEIETEQGQVANHVQNLVSRALIGIAQGVAQYALPAKDQEVGRTGAAPDAGGTEGIGLGVQQEGPARGDLGAERLGREVQAEALRGNGRVQAIVKVV